jgi:hypothetical protein
MIGTGTPAGDPIEAEAIKTAFFRGTSATTDGRDKLFVGSVKTVIGHSESVAGLAALVKTSLALQNSIIPPNLLLQELNPNVRPFYKNLEVPRTATAWPSVPDGSPRRASVNRCVSRLFLVLSRFLVCSDYYVVSVLEGLIRMQSSRATLQKIRGLPRILSKISVALSHLSSLQPLPPP